MKVMLAILSGVVLAVALCSVPVAAQPPVAPTGEAVHDFYGTVTTGGSPAPDGLTVSARVEGVEYDTAVTVGGRYGDGPEPEHMLKIPADDPATPQKDGGLNDDKVEFFVEGVKTNETAIFESMTYSRVSLTVPDSIPAPHPEGEDDQGAEAAQPEGEEDRGAEAAAQPEGEEDQEAEAAQQAAQEDDEAEAAQQAAQEDDEAEAAQPGGEEDQEAEAAGGEGGWWAWWMNIIVIPAVIVVAAIPAIIIDRRRKAGAR